MARLLACWELGGGLGHVAQLAALARALAGLGHESWLASRDVVALKALADAPFARVIQAPIWVRGRKAGPTFSYGQMIAGGGFADDEGLSLLVRAWLGVFETAQAEGVFGSHAPASLLAAHVARLPAVRLGTPFTCPPPRVSYMPWIRAWQPADDAVADRVVRAVCRHFGAPVLSGLAELLGTATPFLLSWPELEYATQRSDSDYYGPLIGLNATAAADWPAGGGPRVLVYLPFGRPLAPPLVAALAARGWPVVWLSESGFDGPLPHNIRHEAEPVAMAAACADADIFVTRGGHGSALDAIGAGCPMLILPDTLETECNARALVAAGLGLRVAASEVAADRDAMGAALDRLALADAPERAAAQAARVRHADHDAPASALLLARRAARAMKLL